MTCSPIRVAAIVLLVPAALAAEPAAFRDDFDSLDTGRWYISDGWSNGDWQACTWSRDKAVVENGVLRLRLADAPDGSGGQLCGEVQTNDRFLYGTFEARIRTDAASGVNAAFFTYIGPVHEQPHDEIDVEILTRDPSQVHFNTYRDGEPGDLRAVALPNAGSADSDFHTYSFVWEEDRLRWYVDGNLMHEAGGADLPRAAQKIYLSHWNTLTLTDWMGEFVDPGRPLDMEVDWVSYTPLGADCPFEGSVACLDDVKGP